MKWNSLCIIALCASVPALACAKKTKTPQLEQPKSVEQVVVNEEETPVITEECDINVSLFFESCKNKMYQDAYEPWWQVYQNCPNANKAIYSRGATMVKYLYEKTSDSQEKDRLRKLLMEMYDKRIKYFGDDSEYPVPYILGQKAVDYSTYFPEDTLKLCAYGWLKQSVEGMKSDATISSLEKLFEVSYNLYRSDKTKYGEQFISDYQMAAGYLADQAADATNKNAAVAGAKKDYMDQLFAVSGAADCGKLDELYASVVEKEKSNIEVLGKLAKLYRKMNCTESEVYFAACRSIHQLQPTEESAAGCGKMSLKKDDYAQAITYFQQAVDLSEDASSKADYLYYIAQIYYSRRNYTQARSMAQQSLSQKAGQGRCYILIGLCYTTAKPYSAEEYGAARAAILNKTVYWAAVDKFIQARNVDSSVAAEANKYIALYSKYFPTSTERFDLPGDFGSGSFHVGGWVGETTSCR